MKDYLLLICRNAFHRPPCNFWIKRGTLLLMYPITQVKNNAALQIFFRLLILLIEFKDNIFRCKSTCSSAQSDIIEQFLEKMTFFHYLKPCKILSNMCKIFILLHYLQLTLYVVFSNVTNSIPNVIFAQRNVEFSHFWSVTIFFS